MKIFTFILTVFFSFQLIADEHYAVVINNSTELMNEDGFIVQKIRKGTVVKVRQHNTDRHALVVLLEGKKYYSIKRSFKVIESILEEEVRLLKSVTLLREKVFLLNGLQKEKILELEMNEEKLLRVDRWIEVQKDTAFSVDYFRVKTKKSRALKKVLARKVSLLKIELKSINKDLEIKDSDLKNESIILKSLQEKLKPLKAEKDLFDKGFMTIEVVAKYAPIFQNGEIVKYIKKETQLKVDIDHDLADWYVLRQGKKKYYIASSDVKIKF